MTDEIERAVRAEVEALHEIFVAWFAGTIAKERFESEILSRLDPGMTFIAPTGALLDYDALISMLRQRYGSNPDLRITIRNLQIRHVLDSHIVATYEERQFTARTSAPSETVRISTAVFAKAMPLRWLHVHETWMPEEQAS